MSTAEILVSRNDLLQALRVLEGATKGKNPPDLVVSSRPGVFILRAGASSFEIAGKGHLLDQTRLPGRLVKSIRLILPASPEIVISQQPGTLAVGSFRFSCVWEEQAKSSISIPINASLADILAISEQYSPAEIDQCGLRPKCDAAARERWQRTEKALEYLQPLGVTKEDLNLLVESTIQRVIQDNDNKHTEPVQM